MKKHGKKYTQAKEKISETKQSKSEAIKTCQEVASAKFDESIDVSLKLNLKQSKGGDLSLRTVVNLPNGSGKKNKLAVLCEADKIDEAKKAGADIVGSDDLLEKIASGKAKRNFSEEESGDMTAMRGAAGGAKGGPADYQTIDKFIKNSQGLINFDNIVEFRKIGKLGEFK